MEFTATPVLAPGQDAPKPVVQETLKTNAQTNTEAQATPTAPKEDKDAFSEKFSALTRKEKRIFEEREKVKRSYQSLSHKEQELVQREAKLKEWEAINDPIKALQAKGFTYQQATEWVLNNGAPTAEHQVNAVKQELEAFKRQQEEQNRIAQEQSKKEAQAELDEVLVQFKGEINEFVRGKTESYELINLFDQTNLVYDTIHEYFNANSKILSIKEASDLVEKYLEDQVKKTTATKKFQKLYSPQPTSAKSTGLQQPSQTQSKTLNNNMTSSAPSFLPAATENDRMARAMAALDKR